jgi:hypothetical protein
MNSLKSHVDAMFSKYKESKQIKELRYEVLSNLEARVQDLTGSGMEYNEAVNKAIASIDSIDHLIDGNRQVYANKYKLEYIQIILLYSIIAWVLTMPLRIIGLGIVWNMIFFIISIVIGIWYFTLNKKGDSKYFQLKSFISVEAAFKMRKSAWIIWSLYIIISTLFSTALYFGSNIWFSRPVIITGPYEFVGVAIRFLLPLITMIIPLIFNVAPRLILKYEVGEDNEDKE